MNKSLHHSFDIDVAQEYGIEAALLIHHFQHWIAINKRKNTNNYDGRTWMYQTLEDIAAHFPYLTIDRIRDLIDMLVVGKTRKMKTLNNEPVLIRGNYNKTKFDRTIWYAFKDESRWISQKSFTKREISHIGSGRPPTPIPYTKTNTNDSDLIDPNQRLSDDDDSNDDPSKLTYIQAHNKKPTAITTKMVYDVLKKFDPAIIEAVIARFREKPREVSSIVSYLLSAAEKAKNDAIIKAKKERQPKSSQPNKESMKLVKVHGNKKTLRDSTLISREELAKMGQFLTDEEEKKRWEIHQRKKQIYNEKNKNK